MTAPAGGDRHRVEETVVSREEDTDRDDEQCGAVEESREYFQAVEAVGAPFRGRPFGKPNRQVGDTQSQQVGEHVAGIGKQGQGVGEKTAYRFDDEGDTGQNHRP